MSSHDWKLTVVSVTDGDTVRGHLLGDPVELIPGWGTVPISLGIKGVPLRLIILDTPERGAPGFGTAARDLADWMAAHLGRLRAETYESAGWDRFLADIYVDGDRGNTATQYMLKKGWGIYL